MSNKFDVVYASVARGAYVGRDPAALLKEKGFEGDWRSTDHRITVRHPKSVIADGVEVGPVEDLEIIRIEVYA